MSTMNVMRAMAVGALVTMAACSDKGPLDPGGNPAPAAVATVQVGPGTTAMMIGETKQLSAVLKDSAGSVLNNRQVTWTSSSNALATVSASGMVTAVAAGTVTIRARSEGREGEATVTIAAAQSQVASIEIVASAPDTLEAWDTLNHAAIVRDSTGQVLQGRTVTWSSSNPAIAAIDPVTGVLTGLDRGTVTITATSEGKTATTTRVVIILYRSISTGSMHACNLASGGIAWCWGLNGREGRIGGATMEDDAMSAMPVRVPGDHRFVQLETYSRTTCGRTAQGQVWCWGSNAWGVLGIGNTTTGQSNMPVQVQGGHTFTDIAAGAVHMCGLTAAGRVYCWGYNSSGELGTGNRTYSPQPVAGFPNATFARIEPGSEYSCGVLTSGVSQCWGYGGLGNLGDGAPISYGNTSTLTPVQVTGGHALRELSIGQYTTCGLTAGGSAYCWGRNGNKFGNGGFNDSSTPVAVAGGHAFRTISVGYGHVCAITLQNAVYCWGANGNGQLGVAGMVNGSALPVRAGGDLLAAEISAANVSTGHASFTCAISSDRLTSYCWGRNDTGQLGNGTTNPSNIANHQPSIVQGQRPL
jgi:alpha-tubulin suppressor-like RCC1 family protein